MSMALVARCWNRLAAARIRPAVLPLPLHRLSATRSYHQPQYLVKVGIPEFLKGVGNGVEGHAAKLEAEIGDFQKLLVTRTLRLKKLGIPCKHLGPRIPVKGCYVVVFTNGSHRKLILKYTHKYRLGLWRPRADSSLPQSA